MKSKVLSGVAVAALALAGCATAVGPDPAPTAGDRAGNIQATCAGRIRRITDAGADVGVADLSALPALRQCA
jgi:hypothetical protein